MKGERGSQSIERGGWITNKMPIKRGLPVIVSEQVRFLSQKIEKQLSEVIVLQAIRESEAFESKYNVFPRDIN